MCWLMSIQEMVQVGTASYIEKGMTNQNGFRTIYTIIDIVLFDTIVYIRPIVAIVLIPIPKFYH